MKLSTLFFIFATALLAISANALETDRLKELKQKYKKADLKERSQIRKEIMKIYKDERKKQVGTKFKEIREDVKKGSNREIIQKMTEEGKSKAEIFTALRKQSSTTKVGSIRGTSREKTMFDKMLSYRENLVSENLSRSERREKIKAYRLKLLKEQSDQASKAKSVAKDDEQ